MSSIAVLDDPFPLAAQSTIVRAGGIVRDPTLGQVPPDGALVESVCSRSASKAIFAFSAASIFRLGFFIIRSVYHDRAGRSPIKPPVPKSGSTSLVLALMHHPVDWLAPFERDCAQHLLSRHVDFVLHGHVHDPEGYGVVRAPSGTAFFGAGSWSRGAENRSSFLLVDVADHEVRVQPHLYQADEKGFLAMLKKNISPL